jgi:hypothetical protein
MKTIARKIIKNNNKDVSNCSFGRHWNKGQVVTSVAYRRSPASSLPHLLWQLSRAWCKLCSVSSIRVLIRLIVPQFKDFQNNFCRISWFFPQRLCSAASGQICSRPFGARTGIKGCYISTGFPAYLFKTEGLNLDTSNRLKRGVVGIARSKTPRMLRHFLWFMKFHDAAQCFTHQLRVSLLCLPSPCSAWLYPRS